MVRFSSPDINIVAFAFVLSVTELSSVVCFSFFFRSFLFCLFVCLFVFVKGSRKLNF